MMQLPEPMLTAPTSSVAVPPGYVAEPKWDGFRTFVLREVGGTAQIRSRHGTDLTAAFPEIAAAADALPAAVGDLALDAELVLWNAGRLDFEALLRRLNRTSANARRLAAETPANVVVFDVLHYGSSMIEKPYRARRQALERIFSEYGLGPPWVLCPATTDPQQIAQWLTAWSRVGIEGVCFKNPDQPYLPGRRAWLKYRIRDSTEALVAAVTGSLTRPASVLLGRYDDTGTLRYAGRSTPLHVGAALALAELLVAAGSEHPWKGRRFSAAWGTSAPLVPILVVPELVAEVSVDVARTASGQWRHPARYLRIRPDVDPADVPLFDGGDEPAAG
jgi:ATP-dependent DNA ligase